MTETNEKLFLNPFLPLQVTVLGTPAQDGGDVETLFMQPNAFDDITVVMMAHPSRYNISRKTFLAKTE